MQEFDVHFLTAGYSAPDGMDSWEDSGSSVPDAEILTEEVPQEDTGINTPETGRAEEPGPGQKEVLPAETGQSPENGGRQGTVREQVLLNENQEHQATQLSVPAPEAQEISPALPFFFGALAALLLSGLALWLLRRRGKGGRTHGGSFPSGTVETAYLHEIGARDSQQDAFCITGEDAPAHGVLAAVADGMGGLVDSGQVSNALTGALVEAYAPSEEAAPARQLQLLFQQALRRVEERLKGSTAQSGSTLVTCLVKDGALSWLSVGDSRIYLWRGGGLVQLNRDHDFHHDLTILAMQGEMELTEADSDRRRESLTSYIGRDFPRKVEWNPEPVQLISGDRVLLVSDGVYRALSQKEIARCLANRPQEAAEKLRAEIKEKHFPQQDNYTAVILSII